MTLGSQAQESQTMSKAERQTRTKTSGCKIRVKECFRSGASESEASLASKAAVNCVNRTDPMTPALFIVLEWKCRGNQTREWMAALSALLLLFYL